MATTTTNKRTADGEGPATKQFKTDYSADSIIKVLVGPQETAIAVHENIVCKNSPFFQAACSGKWMEAQEGIVRLPEAEVDTFEVFMKFVYSGQFNLAPMSATPGRKHRRCHVWTLASYLQCHQLCNAIIDATLQATDRDVSAQNINQVWTADRLGQMFELVPGGSNFRRLIVDLSTTNITVESFEKGADRWPREVLQAAAKRRLLEKKNDSSNIFTAPIKVSSSSRYGRKVGWKKGAVSLDSVQPHVRAIKPTYQNRCHYHEHKDGEATCSETIDERTEAKVDLSDDDEEYLWP